MIVATVADIMIISVLALRGIEMQAISVAVAVTVFAAAVLFGFFLDFIKVPVFRRLGIL
jgi:H+-transporting ATPase